MSGLFNQLQKIQRSMLEQSVQDDLTSLAEKVSQTDTYIMLQSKTYSDLCPKDSNGVVSDWLPAINQAITDAQSLERPIRLPFGDVKISNSIVVPTGIKLEGYGKYITKIKPQGAFPAIILNGTDFTNGCWYVELSNLQIDGGNIATIGVKFNWARECWINDCYIIHCVKGITGLQSWSNGVRSTEIVASTDTNVELAAQCNDFNFIDVQFDSAGNYGLHTTDESYAVNLTGCVIQNNGKDGILLDAGRVINIISSYFENNNTSQTAGCGEIRSAGTTVTVYALTIIGSQLWSKYAQAGIVLDKTYQATLMGINAGPLVGGATTQYGVQTSTNTNGVFLTGFYPTTLTGNNGGLGINDVGHVITFLNNRYMVNMGWQNSTTANRPTSPFAGQVYLDTTVGKPIWRNPTNNGWMTANGVMPENRKTNASVTQGATSFTITLPIQELDANYSVYVTPSWNTTWWATSTDKYSTQCKVYFGTAAPASATLDWKIER